MGRKTTVAQIAAVTNRYDNGPIGQAYEELRVAGANVERVGRLRDDSVPLAHLAGHYMAMLALRLGADNIHGLPPYVLDSMLAVLLRAIATVAAEDGDDDEDGSNARWRERIRVLGRTPKVVAEAANVMRLQVMGVTKFMKGEDWKDVVFSDDAVSGC